jgi:uncharacterized membrane protein
MSIAETEPKPPAAPPPRIDLVDCARGLALLAMFVFHFSWDLSFFRLIQVDVAMEPGWRWFARCIAGSFLAIVGVSLVLATRKGLRPKPYLKRLMLVAGAAALVSLGTWFALPNDFIFFGILHQIALASVLALPFLRLPVAVTAAAAALCFALPHLVDSEIFDTPWLTWLGLGYWPVHSADFVPVFPWFGCVLGGVVLGRLALPHIDDLSRWQARSAPARLVAWAGRHSLPIYLLHQPVFFALLLAATQIAALPAADARPFLSACERSCAATGQASDVCRSACSCTVQGLKRDALWTKVLADKLSETERTRMSEIAQACYQRP